MATEKALMEAITKIEADMSGMIAAAAVDLESGMTLAAKSNRSEFDLTVASAYNSELVKQKMKIMKALNLKASLEDMVLSLTDQIHVIKLFPGGTSFLYLAADRSATNLAILRTAINKHTANLD
jgi:hypothetical protein